MAGFIEGFGTGLVCTAVGVYLTWLSGKEYRQKAKTLADAQLRIAQLEQEKKNWQALERFTPRIAIGGTPSSGQFITVTDSVIFRVAEMEYLTADAVTVSSQSVERTGTGIQIPIDESIVTEIQKQGCDPTDGSFSMCFRLHLEVEGIKKPILFPVKVAVNSAFKLDRMAPLGMQTLK